MVFIEIFLIILLIVLNGLFAMSELAVVSARRVRLQQLARAGSRGARVAMHLIADPGRFLATVQIGISLVAVVAGAFGGATLGHRLGNWLDRWPAIAPHGNTIAIGLVVIAIAYLSLVLGELVPKRIALASPERVASLVAPLMHLLSRLAAPAVSILKISTDAALRLLRLSGTRETAITEEEVKALIDEGTRAGIFVPQEREMIAAVLRLADRPVRVIMTPRPDVVWLDERADAEAMRKTLQQSRFSRFPVCQGSIDRALGIVHSKDLLQAALNGERIEPSRYMVPPLFVHDRTPALKLPDLFRRERLHMAIVVDEFGATEGVATPIDILESVAGDLPERGEEVELSLIQRDDGSWLVDGAMPVDEFEDRVGLRGLLEERDFHTMAGFVLQHLGHLPTVGECFDFNDIHVEVVDMDGRRIDKILIRPPVAHRPVASHKAPDA
jgi:putative hemolysin